MPAPVPLELALGPEKRWDDRAFFECVKSRKEPNAPVEAGVAAARAGHIGNLAYKGTGQTAWPVKS